MLMLSSLPYLLQDPTGIDLFTVNIRIIYVIEWSTGLHASLTVLIVFFRAVKMKKEENCIEKIDQPVTCIFTGSVQVQNGMNQN